MKPWPSLWDPYEFTNEFLQLDENEKSMVMTDLIDIEKTLGRKYPERTNVIEWFGKTVRAHRRFMWLNHGLKFAPNQQKS